MLTKPVTWVVYASGGVYCPFSTAKQKIPFINEYIQLRSILKTMPLLTTSMLLIGSYETTVLTHWTSL